RTGLPLSSIAKGLETAERKGLITRADGRVTPTELGFDFLSDLQELFLAD
ncbi:MAG: oxygen-independent coproporphyrinogen III oxidase-like protein, partial [Comamonas sp.]